MSLAPKHVKPHTSNTNKNKEQFIKPTVQALHNVSPTGDPTVQMKEGDRSSVISENIIQKQESSINPEGKSLANATSGAPQSSSVQKYVHPDKAGFKTAKDRAQSNYDKTYEEYKTYYLSIKKITSDSTDMEILASFSEANRTELTRLEQSIADNQALYDLAAKDEKQWNKLDGSLSSVVNAFNGKKGYKGTDKLNPNLVKALMFSESEMGAGVDYKKLVKSVPKSNPKAIYQLNLGRVTDGNVYNSVVKEFKIPVKWQTNYQAMGNKNDVMLAAGALIQKREYAIKKKGNSNLKAGQHWFNAVVAYKGISSEGKGKAELVWKLYTTGVHPYTSGKKLF